MHVDTITRDGSFFAWPWWGCEPNILRFQRVTNEYERGLTNRSAVAQRAEKCAIFQRDDFVDARWINGRCRKLIRGGRRG